METQLVTRGYLVFGLILSVGALVIAPGLGAAAAAVAYMGWLRESTLRMATRQRLIQAGLELEREAARYAALLAVVENVDLLTVEYKMADEDRGTVH